MSGAGGIKGRQAGTEVPKTSGDARRVLRKGAAGSTVPGRQAVDSMGAPSSRGKRRPPGPAGPAGSTLPQGATSKISANPQSSSQVGARGPLAEPAVDLSLVLLAYKGSCPWQTTLRAPNCENADTIARCLLRCPTPFCLHATATVLKKKKEKLGEKEKGRFTGLTLLLINYKKLPLDQSPQL